MHWAQPIRQVGQQGVLNPLDDSTLLLAPLLAWSDQACWHHRCKHFPTSGGEVLGFLQGVLRLSNL